MRLAEVLDDSDDLKYARNQLATYARELPLAFRCNVACVVSDGTSALCGTAFTAFEHFAPWNVDDDGEPVKQPPERDEDLPLVLMMYGLFQHERFIELLNGYVTFARTEDGLVKRLAKPHQYFAVSSVNLRGQPWLFLPSWSVSCSASSQAERYVCTTCGQRSQAT